MTSSTLNLPASNDATCMLSHLRAIEFTGPEARTFLQTQLSSDLQLLQPEQPQFTTWCRANGRVLTLGWLFDTGAVLRWFIPSSNAELVASQLAVYRLRSKVQIALLHHWVSNSGPHKLPDGRSIGIFDNASKPEDASNAWILADILQAWPTLGGNERFLPQMLGVEQLGGLSLKKGCFPGQEVIARVHYKGEVKRTLARYMETNHIPATESPSSTTDVELVQSAIDSANQINALAVVKKPAPIEICLDIMGQQRTLKLQAATPPQS